MYVSKPRTLSDICFDGFFVVVLAVLASEFTVDICHCKYLV